MIQSLTSTQAMGIRTGRPAAAATLAVSRPLARSCGQGSVCLPQEHGSVQRWRRCLALLLWGAMAGGCLVEAAHPEAATRVVLRDAPLVQFRGGNSPAPGKPGETDCNSPLHWDGAMLHLFNSAGHPWRSTGSDLFHLDQSYVRCEYNNRTHGGRWIECTWKEPHGPLYGWYHFEPAGLVPGTGLTAPRIGAARSRDNGATWEDLGVVLEAPAGTLNPSTRNFYFAGGNGDFSILLDARKRHLYFFFSAYSGKPSDQGVAMARMAWKNRDAPVGKVYKWHHQAWHEPGLGGAVTPVFPARVDWHQADADAYWGPSLHWNHHLRQYVMLLNRAMDKDWTQEGVYISFNRDLTDPGGWSAPRKILGGLRKDQWYPQIVGLDAARRETDKLAGREARLFVRGESRWELRFLKMEEAP